MYPFEGLNEEEESVTQRPQPASIVTGVSQFSSKININIKLNSIYDGSLVEFAMTCAKAFSLSFGSKIPQIVLGKLVDDQTITSVEKDGLAKIQFFSIDCLSEIETPIENPRKRLKGFEIEGTKNLSYGQRFFPFVCSKLSCNIKCTLPVAFLTIDIPDFYRFIWDTLEVLNENGEPISIEKRQGYSPEKSTYSLEIPDELSSGFQLSWKIRTHGFFLVRAIILPIIYTGLAFISVLMASYISFPVTVGAIIAGIIFLIRQWTGLNPPQQDTLLRKIYLNLGTFLVVSGIICIIFDFIQRNAGNFLHLPFVLLASIKPLAWLISLFFVASYSYKIISENNFFSRNGNLKKLEQFWALRIAKKDLKDLIKNNNALLLSSENQTNFPQELQPEDLQCIDQMQQDETQD